MKKILILGASSFIGPPIVKAISTDYKITDYKIIGTYHNNIPKLSCELKKLDVTNKEELLKLLQTENPNIIINCAAISNIDECEWNQKLCRKINVKPTEVIVDYCKNNPKIKYIFFSSSQVFSGESSHKETDRCNPLNYYGKCKLECEELIKNLENYVIIRPCVIYGKPEDYQHKNLFTYIFDLLSANRVFTAYTDQVRSPVFVEDVALLTKEIIGQGKKGIFHCGGETITIYKFALEIANCFNFASSLVKPELSAEKTPAYKPKNTALDCSYAKTELNFTFHTIYKSLIKIKEELRKKEKE